MIFVPVQYFGRKVYRDKTSLRNVWAHGDTKAVPEADAKMLLRFAEFKKSEAKVSEAEDLKAKTMQKSVEAKEQEDKDETEVMLMTIDSMDKGALGAYARKYEVELDLRKKVDTLRHEVSLLIEQFGAR